MPSWKREKTQKVHRERPQPESSAHLGFLERKKDYKKRAEDQQKRKETIKRLKRKAEDRNPDEFYFKMVKTKKLDGEHQLKEESVPVLTGDQEKLIATQDRRYVLYRLSKELKKIERCKQTLHLIDSDEKKNQHTVFVDTDKEVKEFDVAKYFDTHPAFIDRAFNRPHLDALKKGNIAFDGGQLQVVMENKNKAYRELTKRIDRAKQLKIVADKLESKLHALDNYSQKKEVVAETKTMAAQYKFQPKRKK